MKGLLAGRFLEIEVTITYGHDQCRGYWREREGRRQDSTQEN